MKPLIVLAALLFSVSTLQAQLKTIGTGPTFDEPESGEAKILLLKDKRTAYLQVTAKEGIKVRLYDAAHKETVVKTVEHAYGKLKNMSVDGCFEINNTIALFISEYDEREPVLYRIVLDSKTGNLLSQSEVARMDKFGMKEAFAVGMGGVPMPEFMVRKDPESDYYAIAVYNTFVSDRDKRIAITQYNGKHEVANNAFVSTPGDKYKYVSLLDMVVMGNEGSRVLIYGFNTPSAAAKEGELLLAELANNTVNYISIKDDKGRKSTDGVIQYNKKNGQLYVLTQTALSSPNAFWSTTTKVYYDVLRYQIDARTGSVTTTPPISADEVEKKFQEVFGKRKRYSGIVQNFYINEDGSHTIVMEGLETKVYRSSSGTTVIYTLGNIVALQYDENFNLKAATLVPKSQILTNGVMSGKVSPPKPLYHYKRDRTAQKMENGNQYKSFSYLNAINKNYILLNDIEENAENLKKGKLTSIQSVGHCDAFYFVAEPNQTLPERQFVFGAPTEKKGNNLALFTISDYDRSTSTYATLKLAKGKQVNVVWLKAE